MRLDEQEFYFQVTGSLEKVCVDIYTHTQSLQAYKKALVHFSFLNCQECVTTVSRLSVQLLTIKGYKPSGMQVQQAEQTINCTKYHLD